VDKNLIPIDAEERLMSCLVKGEGHNTELQKKKRKRGKESLEHLLRGMIFAMWEGGGACTRLHLSQRKRHAHRGGKTSCKVITL